MDDPIQTLSMPVYLSSCLLALALLLALAFPACAQEVQPERTLTVSGRGVASLPFTDAVFNLGVQAEGRTAADAQAQLRERINPLVARLKQLQVQKLATTSVQLYPRYSDPTPKDGPSQVVGFTASSNLQFQVPLAQAGTVLDAAVGSGANVVQNLSFTAPDAQYAEARADALARAVADARAQAEVVLKSLGLAAKQVRTVQVGSPPRQPPMPFVKASRPIEADSMPIEGGAAEVEATVTLQISY
ncbi:MAG: SIMPL domain-containing protein [Aphanocapsa lilacina HA4352-LM1]|nr:SIMPL domain-containing protein [Aphanocapsa lilacina HA4352-LM1]